MQYLCFRLSKWLLEETRSLGRRLDKCRYSPSSVQKHYEDVVCRLEHPAVIRAAVYLWSRAVTRDVLKTWEIRKNRRESLASFSRAILPCWVAALSPAHRGSMWGDALLGWPCCTHPHFLWLLWCFPTAVLVVGSCRIPFAVRRKWAARLEQRIFADRRKNSSSPFIDSNLCLFGLNSGNRNTSVFRWLCTALTNRWQSCLMVFDLTEWLISSAF